MYTLRMNYLSHPKKKRVLFVCSQARNRSFTARNLAVLGGMLAECAGTDSSARLPLTNALLLEADVVVCMEKHHTKAVKKMMGAEGKTVYTLAVEDLYNPFDQELANTLVHKLKDLDFDVSNALAVGYSVYVQENEMA